jgi:hypothetical protein
MKNYFNIILGICTLFTTSCSTEESEVKNDLQKENLRGEVLFVKESSTNANGENYGFTISEYNELGYKMKRCNSSQYQNALSEFEYNDNKINRVNETAINSENKKIQGVLNYYYDQDGLLSKISPTDITFVSSLDKQYQNSQENYTTFEYNDKNLTKEIYYQKGVAGTTVNYYYSQQLDSTIHNTIFKEIETKQIRIYDSNGNLKIVKYYWKSDRNIEKDFSYSITNYSYDDYGNIIEEKIEERIENNPIEQIVEKTNYSYDSKGNWVKKVEYDKDGKEEYITERKIYYLGDDVAEIKKEIEDFKVKLDNNNVVETEEEQPTKIENSNKSSYNSSSSQNENTNQTKQWVNCNECHGRGEIVCRECNGTTLMFCGTCHGRGTFNSGNGTETCYYCKGALKVKCTRCYGKGIEGRCRRCGGRGQIQQ